MDYTVHGILQARILEWVAFPFSRGSSQSRDQTQVSRIAGRFFNQLSHKGSPVSRRNILSLPLLWKTKKIISNIFGKLDGFLYLPGHISKGSHYNFLFKYAVGPVIKMLSAFPRQRFTATLASISRAPNKLAQCAGWEHSLASPGSFQALSDKFLWSSMQPLKRGKWFLHKTFM